MTLLTSFTPQTWGLIGIASALILVSSRIIFLIFFHPLAKYPGPVLARLTDFYAAYHGWKGDIHIDMWRCHDRFGSRVRYGPNRLIVNTVEALDDIYSTSNSSKFIKASVYVPLVHRSPNTLTIRDRKGHARRRRLVAQGVSEKAQRGFEHRVLSHINTFCRQVFPNTNSSQESNGWSDKKDMSEWCYFLSFDIMADIVFGARYNLLESDRFRYVIHAIDASNTRMSGLVQIPDLAAWKIDKYFFRHAIAARNRFVKFVVRVIKDRIAKDKGGLRSDVEAVGPENADIFAHLAAAKDPETGLGFQPDEIHAESTTLIIAGSDTSSTALSGLFFYLATNPSAYAKASAEVRAAFPDRESIVMGSALASCTYLRACVDESLRMSPSVGSGLFREVLPGGATVDSNFIPAGHDVAVPIYAIHHNSTYYTEPFEYRPERWLTDDGTGSVERARSAFNPFSIGVRSCLGKGVANTELMLTMATVLFLGDFKIAAGDAGNVGRGQHGAAFGRHRPNEYQLWDYITAQKEGPVLQFASRSPKTDGAHGRNIHSDHVEVGSP